MQRKWAGRDLFNLIFYPYDQLVMMYPDQTRENLKNKKKLYRRKIREGDKMLLAELLESMDGVENLASENSILRSQLQTALRQRDVAKDKTNDYVAALKAAILELWGDVHLNLPRPRKITPAATATPETAILVTSDWQLGKVTPTYDSDVCEQRVQTMAEKTIELGKMHSRIKPVNEIKVYLLGDLVEGENIFPHQSYQLDSSLYRQVGVDGPRILSNLIAELLNFYQKVHVVGVIGNHGALKMKGGVNPETNMDRLLYTIVAGLFKHDDRVTFNIPDGHGERNWYAVDYVDQWGFLLAHGDQIRGWGGIPFYGALKKALGWADAIEQPWDYLMIGHHHTPTMLTYNKRQVRFNGTTESTNTFAQEVLAAVGHPTQWMGFVSPNQGITSEYWLNLEEKTPNLKRYKEL